MPDTTPLITETLTATSAGLARAAALLRSGGLVSFPTETVYGLGADARNDRAVARIFEAKGRPRFNPLIVHLPDRATAARFGQLDWRAERLAAAFWPGPLTLVVPLRTEAGLSPLVTAGLDTVALRVPAHPVAQGLLAAFGGPLAAPSANPSGRISPTRAAHVLAGLSGRIEAVIDGGPCEVGVESTIVGLAGGPEERAVLLRPGGLPVEALAESLGSAPDMPGAGPGNTPSAPGQLAAHYAPRGRVRLDATGPESGEIWIGFGPDAAEAHFNLSPTGDLVEAAARLFHVLHDADSLAGPRGAICVSPVPESGLGLAINDRLRRAAAPHD